MTTASLAPQATSDGSIATHCTISVVSTLVTPNLATTRMSYYLLHPWSLTKWLQKSSAVYELHALSLTRPPRLTNPLSPLPPSPPIRSLPLVGKLRICPPLGLDKEILNSPRFFIPLIIPETQRCYTILTSRQYVKNQEQSDATAASPEVIATYYSGMTLLPKNNSLCPH